MCGNGARYLPEARLLVEGYYYQISLYVFSVKRQIWLAANYTLLHRHSGRVGLKSDGTTGQTTGHLAARGSASRYMARRKATRQATELTTV